MWTLKEEREGDLSSKNIKEKERAPLYLFSGGRRKPETYEGKGDCPQSFSGLFFFGCRGRGNDLSFFSFGR